MASSLVSDVRTASKSIDDTAVQREIIKRINDDTPSLDALLGRAGPSRPQRSLGKKRRTIEEEVTFWEEQESFHSRSV
jgi:hypothetical protein